MAAPRTCETSPLPERWAGVLSPTRADRQTEGAGDTGVGARRWPRADPLLSPAKRQSVVVKAGTTTSEVRSFLTSVPRSEANAGQLLEWVRGHWSSEYRLHSVRDVPMGEDASRVHQGSGPQVMAAVRNATIGFLRLTGATNIAEAIRRNASRVG